MAGALGGTRKLGAGIKTSIVSVLILPDAVGRFSLLDLGLEEWGVREWVERECERVDERYEAGVWLGVV